MRKEQQEEIDYLENQIIIMNEVKCEIEDKKERARIEKEILGLKHRIAGLKFHYNKGEEDGEF